MDGAAAASTTGISTGRRKSGSGFLQAASLMPWVIRKALPYHRFEDIAVDKRIYTQFVYSDCGPIGLAKDAQYKGVSTVAIRAVVTAIASRCKDDDLMAWPSIERIAADTGLVKDTVRLALRAARIQGWVRQELLRPRQVKRSIGGKRPFLYRLCLPDFDLRRARTVMRNYSSHEWRTDKIRWQSQKGRETEQHIALSN